MEISPDFRELFLLFNAHQVEYMVVGGYAVAHHGHPRYTRDMDVYVRPSPDNSRRVIAALTEFGFGGLGLVPEDFQLPGKVVQMGIAPNRIDVMCSVGGLQWEEASAGQVRGFYGDVEVSYIGRRELILNKRAVGRRKDLADLEALDAL